MSDVACVWRAGGHVGISSLCWLDGDLKVILIIINGCSRLSAGEIRKIHYYRKKIKNNSIFFFVGKILFLCAEQLKECNSCFPS